MIIRPPVSSNFDIPNNNPTYTCDVTVRQRTQTNSGILNRPSNWKLILYIVRILVFKISVRRAASAFFLFLLLSWIRFIIWQVFSALLSFRFTSTFWIFAFFLTSNYEKNLCSKHISSRTQQCYAYNYSKTSIGI